MVTIEVFYESAVQSLIWLCIRLLREKNYEKARYLREPLTCITRALLDDGDPLLYGLLDEMRWPLRQFLAVKELIGPDSEETLKEIKDLLDETEEFLKL